MDFVNNENELRNKGYPSNFLVAGNSFLSVVILPSNTRCSVNNNSQMLHEHMWNMWA